MSTPLSDSEYNAVENRAVHEETKRLMCLRLQGVNLVPCSNCTRVCPLFELQSCSACHGTAYCSKACQVLAWPSHKRPCRRAARVQLATGTVGGFSHGAEHPPLSLPCMFCRKSTDMVELIMCSGCHSTGYCSRACRHGAWREGHRLVCGVSAAQTVSVVTGLPTSARVIAVQDTAEEDEDDFVTV